MKTAQTIKALQEALQSYRNLHAYSVELGPIITDLKTLAAHHEKKHGGPGHAKLIESLRAAARAVQKAIKKEVQSSERVICDIISMDDDLKRTPHSEGCRGFQKGFHGRHATNAQQQLSDWN